MSLEYSFRNIASKIKPSITKYVTLILPNTRLIFFTTKGSSLIAKRGFLFQLSYKKTGCSLI